jgi:tellurite resistance protein TerB
MADFFTQFRSAIGEHIERFRSRDVLEATMAAAALVSMADGTVNLTEASTIDQALEAVHQLDIYDKHEAVDLYHRNIEQLKADPNGARENILKTISKISRDQQASRILIKICIAIGKSDEDLIGEEKSTIIEIAARLGIDSAEIEM